MPSVGGEPGRLRMRRVHFSASPSSACPWSGRTSWPTDLYFSSEGHHRAVFAGALWSRRGDDRRHSGAELVATEPVQVHHPEPRVGATPRCSPVASEGGTGMRLHCERRLPAVQAFALRGRRVLQGMCAVLHAAMRSDAVKL